MTLRSLAEKVDPRHAAVVVVDMQNDFCHADGYVGRMGRDVTPCQQVTGPLGRLLAAARAVGAPVVWLRAQYDPDLVPEPMRARQQEMGKGAVACAGGTWGADFFDLAPAPGEAVVTKHSFAGFTGTDLDTRLKALGVRTVIITGVQTNVCVDSTLREAHALGYYVVVPRDCVASHMAAEHQATLNTVTFLFGDVVQSGELMAAWG